MESVLGSLKVEGSDIAIAPLEVGEEGTNSDRSLKVEECKVVVVESEEGGCASGGKWRTRDHLGPRAI